MATCQRTSYSEYNKDHYDKIKYRINKYVSTHKSIILSEEFEKQEKRKQEILDGIGVEGLEAKIKAIEDKAEKDAKELEDLGAHRDQIEAIYQESEDKIAEIVKGASDKVLDALTEEVNAVKKHCRLIEAVGQEAMKQRHWQKVFDLLKEPMP